jgi:hypothetical protein
MLSIAVGIALLVVRWFSAGLVLYSFLPPIILSATFDEMSPSYEGTFVIFCALLLSAGIIGYRLSLHKDAIGLSWVILSVFFIGTWILAAHANQNYWDLSSALGYGCEEGAPDCALLSGGVPWWRIFFGV